MAACICNHLVDQAESFIDWKKIVAEQKEGLVVSYTGSCPRHGRVEIDFDTYRTGDETSQVVSCMVHLDNRCIDWFDLPKNV